MNTSCALSPVLVPAPLRGTVPARAVQVASPFTSGSADVRDAVVLMAAPAPPLPPAVEAAPVEERSSWRQGMAAAMVALSLCSGAGASTVAAPALASVASTCLPQGSQGSASVVGDAIRCDAQARERDALVGRMLERGARGGPVDPEVARGVHAELDVLPPGILRLLDRNHTAIVVMAPQQTPLDVGVIQPMDVKARFADIQALQETVSAARRASDDQYGRRIAQVQQQVDALLDQEFTSDSRHLLADRRVELQRLTDQRNDLFYRLVYDQSGGLLEPHTIRFPGKADALARMGANARAHRPATLDEIARFHGAATPAEREEFTRLLVAINGENLEQAWRTLAGNDGVAPAERRLLPLEDRIVMPSVYYYRDQATPLSAGGGIDLIGPYHARQEARDLAVSGPAMPISGHDATSLQSWRSGAMKGQYWYQGDLNTVVLPRKSLGKDASGHSTLIHELGHAYEDAVHQLEPRRYFAHQVDRDAAYAFMQQDGQEFPTPYSATSPAEMSAESFALTFEGNARVLETHDDRWAGEFARFLQETSGTAATPLAPAR